MGNALTYLNTGLANEIVCFWVSVISVISEGAIDIPEGEESEDDEGGDSMILIIVGLAVAIAVIAILVLVLRRR